MHKNIERVLLAGPPGSGKSHIALTSEMGVAVIYSDRLGGDADLQGLEEGGVHIYQVDARKPRESALEIVQKLRNKDIAEKKIRTVIWDSPTYNQKQEKMVRVGSNGLNSMQVSSNKGIVFNMMDIANELFLLPVHVVILCHMKKIVHKDKKTQEIIAETWEPDLMPAVLADMLRECSLVGYTWKKTFGDGRPERYGICFTHHSGHTEFGYIKAPNGWGAAEPANLRLLFQKLDQETETRRKAALEALMKDVDLSKEDATPPTEKPEEEGLPAQ